MQNFVQKFIGGFFVLISVYHIIVTVLGYGIIGGESQIMISIGRDALWILFVLTIFLSHIKQIGSYLKKWKNIRLWFVILIGLSVGISFLGGQTISNMMIGIKYGFFYLFIFLTASFVGFVGIKKINKQSMHWIQYFLIGLVIFGFLWQIMKIIKPEMFMNIGYGKFDDFYFGANPPLYYLTSFEGTTRWQGLFSGPNNYGYFLIAFLPLILLWRSNGWNKLKNIIKNPMQNVNFLFVILRITAIAMTLSRAAILGAIFIFVLLAKDWIRKHKKIFGGILGILILGIIGLSILKSESTIGHLEAKFSYIGEIIDNPLGHGLGTSGPAVHHEGTMLPENYFIQIMLDVGTVGFIIWAMVIFQMLVIFKNIKKHFLEQKTSANEQLIFLHWERLYLGRSALLIIALFLHVFEDSMVNYLFFICFGLLSGHLSKLYKHSNITIKDLFVKK